MPTLVSPFRTSTPEGFAIPTPILDIIRATEAKRSSAIKRLTKIVSQKDHAIEVSPGLAQTCLASLIAEAPDLFQDLLKNYHLAPRNPQLNLGDILKRHAFSSHSFNTLDVGPIDFLQDQLHRIGWHGEFKDLTALDPSLYYYWAQKVEPPFPFDIHWKDEPVTKEDLRDLLSQVASDLPTTDQTALFSHAYVSDIPFSNTELGTLLDMDPTATSLLHWRALAGAKILLETDGYSVRSKIEVTDDFMGKSLFSEKLGLNFSTIQKLVKRGIRTVGDLIETGNSGNPKPFLTPSELARVQNALLQRGLFLKGDEDKV